LDITNLRAAWPREYGSKEAEMNTLDQELIHTILQEIDNHLNRGVLPVHNDHLKHLSDEGKVLEYLLYMKGEGLISGDLITKGTNSAPFRITNIRLTYMGIRALRS
jgi:hypothetical protein